MKGRLLAALLVLMPFVANADEKPTQATLTAPPIDPALAAVDNIDGTPQPPVPTGVPGTRSGREIFGNFLAGRADTGCDAQESSVRWERHFSHAPTRLADEDEDVLPLFGYVVDELREADLPTEFALIPFIESGYKPNARNGSGPAGMWQFVASTARNHHVTVGKSYDGRLSAVDSTAAAVRYLKTLYGMFGGDWRLTIMAYNAGEYRVLQSMRRAGMNAANARPAELPGLSAVTYAYVEKLHALACVLDEAQTRGGLLAALDRPVPILAEHALPAGTSLGQWAQQRALSTGLVNRLNPALVAASRGDRKVLAPIGDGDAFAVAQAAPLALPQETTEIAVAGTEPVANRPSPGRKTAKTSADRRTHTVRDGESAWTIARRYGIPVKTLLTRNGLNSGSVLKPGMVLAFDAKP
ncbi:MAG TPA: transglycosylase SLT domain-containing protein [Stenotrophomonas sp.]|jgi:membrane-bound lytic murein transglycosylase D